MDKILEIIKEKLESPVLTNFFIGLLLFNKKVIYAALSTSYNDTINGEYKYGLNTVNSKIELLGLIHNDESYLCFTPSWNVLGLPLIYAIVITGFLPYIKSLFNAFNEHSEILYQKLSKWLGSHSFIAIEKFKVVNQEKEKLTDERNSLRDENWKLKEENDKIKGENKTKQIEIDKGHENTDNMNTLYTTISKEYEDTAKLYNELKGKSKQTIEEVFEGVWMATYEFVKPSKHKDGVEYFRIVNGCELHTSDKANGKFKLRCYIDRYQYINNFYSSGDGNFKYDGIKFRKSFVKVNTKVANPDEFAYCEYMLNSKTEYNGDEDYSDYKLNGLDSPPDKSRIHFQKLNNIFQ